MKIKWSFYERSSKRAVKEIEDFFQIVLPESYKKIARKYNSGYLDPNCWDLNNVKEKVFERLISIDKKDNWNVYVATETICKTTNKRLLAFGDDPFGNTLCFDYTDINENPSIVYHDHEKSYDDELYDGEYVCASFEEFLDMLYEADDNDE